MKIRHGFVSNSSSSSFIIGLGVVKDVTELKGNVSDNLYSLATVNELTINPRWDIRLNGTNLSLESFNSDEVTLDISGLPPEAIIMIVDACGERSSDSDFYDGDDMDYDVGPTDADAEHMSIIDKYCDRGMVLFGAGRNG